MKTRHFVLLTAIFALLWGCDRGEMGYFYEDTAQKRDVVIFYAAAANNISGMIADNIKTIEEGNLPQTESKKTLLIFSHLNVGQDSYLRQVSRNEYGEKQSDTLFTFEAGRSVLETEVMRTVLEEVRDRFPGSEYTLILSSHGSGWLPSGYYLNNQDPVSTGLDIWTYPKRTGVEPAEAQDYPIFGPITKTFGSEWINYSHKSLEMEITHLADALPMHFKTIVMDACLMGGVETAYQLRDVCDKLCVSAAEVPGAGFDYSRLTEALISDSGTPEAFSKAFYNLYVDDSEYGVTSATINTEGLETLAAVCKVLFEKYRLPISKLRAEEVQRFYRIGRHYYFDLLDILVKAGISEDERWILENALEMCVSYKAASNEFMIDADGFRIETYCGLSMYLPSESLATPYLNDFYKGLEWNKATGLVE